jgi:penicillin-binding protein 1A
MQENGAITPGEADGGRSRQGRLRQARGPELGALFHRLGAAQLDLLLPETAEPIEVWTTLDPACSAPRPTRSSQCSRQAHAGRAGRLDRDGAVLAMVGGTDYVTSNYNRATKAVRQPGSAWKLFVYLAALEAGYTPNDEVVDEPVTIEGWSPRNSGGTYAGEIDVRTAFAYSKNTVAAQLGNEVGFSAVAGMAKRFGITTPISHRALDGAGHLERSAADRHDPRLRQWSRRAGRRSNPMASSRSPPLTARCSTSIEGQRNRDAGRRNTSPPGSPTCCRPRSATGTGRAAQIGRPVAGKTGTTSSNKDGWFLGFSSGITTGVWMGRDDSRAVSRAAGRHRARAGLRRLHAHRGRQPSGREVRYRSSSCPPGSSSPTTRR